MLIQTHFEILFTAGVDYVPVALAKLQFTSETTSQTLTIDIIPDELREPSEVIEAFLTGSSIVTDGTTFPFPSDRIQIVVNRAQVVILDDDSRFIHCYA